MPYPVNINEIIETVKKLEGLKRGIINDLVLIYPKFFCNYYFLNYLEKSLHGSDSLFKEKQNYSDILKLFSTLKKMYRRRVYIVVMALLIYFMLGFFSIRFYSKPLDFLSISVSALLIYFITKDYFNFLFSNKQREEMLLQIINVGFSMIELEKRKQYAGVSEQIKQKALLN